MFDMFSQEVITAAAYPEVWQTPAQECKR